MKWILSLAEGFARTALKSATTLALNTIKLSSANSAAIITAGVTFITALNQVMAPKTFAKSMVEAIMEALGEA